MRTYILDGQITALSSISHNGGQSLGVVSKLRREKLVQPDGTVEDVPVISGNSIRGILRDRGMLHMCRSLGYGIEADGTIPGLTLAAFYFLFSGGALTSTGSRGLDIDAARKLRDMIPLVGVFGGAVGNMIMPGKLKVGKIIPVCQETRHLLPESFALLPQASVSVWDYLQEEMYTRKDDEKDERVRGLLSGEVRQLVDQERRIEQAKKGRGEDMVAETGQKQQMRYFVETLAAGTLFYWRLVLDDVTDIEFEAIVTALREFSRQPHLGGKSNVGHGEVAIRIADWLSIDSRVTSLDAQAIDTPVGTRYATHLREQGAAIRDLLRGMQ